MKKIIDILSNICEESFIKAGYQAGFGRVNVSNRPDLCEYQCNGAMALAKAARKKPIDIANEVIQVIKNESNAFSKIEAVMPGFINLDINPEFLAQYITDMGKDPYCGLIREEKKKIIIDYGGANVAKPLHVGHLRSAVIGESLKRIGAALGNDMTGDVHLGDWGLQMGLIIEELKDRGQTEFTIADLEEIYPAASARTKELDENGEPTEEAKQFKNRALEATGRLQGGDAECRKVWERIMELSKADLKRNYDALDVHFELWKGESDVQKYISGMLNKMEKDGVAYESRGALVVDVQEPEDTKEIPPCIIRKSDGAALYATTDLATLLEREMRYNPDANIYVADQRQSLHYLSFFRVSKKADIVKKDEGLSFLGFGTMNGKDGKPFKTRSGGVMRLEFLISDISDAVYKKIRETRTDDDISEEEAREISKVVGLAALKYGDLSNQASKDYVFDIDRFASFEGNTGPYILYSIVRIGSILKKAGIEPDRSVGCTESAYMRFDSVPLGEDSADIAKAVCASSDAKALALSLSRLNDVVLSSWKELAPHKICQFIYEVSEAFNSFYHNVKILSEEDEKLKESCLALLVLTRRVLLLCIAMLGFSAPDKM